MQLNSERATAPVISVVVVPEQIGEGLGNHCRHTGLLVCGEMGGKGDVMKNWRNWLLGAWLVFVFCAGHWTSSYFGWFR